MNNSVKPNIDKYDNFIIDFDGTLVLEDRMFAGAADTLNQLLSMRKNVFIMTNKTIFPTSYYIELLKINGVDFPEENFKTATVTTVDYLNQNHIGQKFFAIAEQSLIDSLENAGLKFNNIPEEIEIVIISLDRFISSEKIQIAAEALKNGARFFAANTDLTCPVNGGEIDDAGITISKLFDLTGRILEMSFGKPSEIMIGQIIGEIDKSRCLLIGDRIETDIVMANKAGIDSVLVETGVKKNGLVDKKNSPTYSLESFSKLLNI